MICRIIRYLIIFLFIVSMGGISFAQQALFSPREEMMMFTLDNLQAGYDKDEAVREAAIETQMKLAESGLSKKSPVLKEPPGEGILKSLKKRSHPYLNFRAAYDTNIDAITDNPKGDILYDTTPGLKINFTGKNKALNFDTHINTEYYNKFTEYNGVDAFAGFSGYININKYILSMTESYNNNYLSNFKELGGRDEIYSRDGILKRRWLNTNSTSLGRYFNRIGFDIGYTRSDIDYEPDYSYDNDRFIDSGRFNTYLRIATKTKLLFGYKHDRTEYRILPEISNLDDYNLALTGALSPKLTYLGRVDYQIIDSKPDYGGDDLTKTDADIMTFTGNIGYAFSNRTNLSFNYNHVISKYSDRLYYSTADALTLTGNHRLAFNPKFNLSFIYGATFTDYPRYVGFEAHSDDYTYGVGLTYAFRQWLDFGLNWTYSKLKSNRSEDTPYKRNLFEFRSNARF